MASFKVTLINAAEGINSTIACADDQSITMPPQTTTLICRSPAGQGPVPPAPGS
jgi:hypothetical protein